MKVEDLDILRPAPRALRLNGVDIDVSFVPTGITFEVDQLVDKMRGMTQEKLDADPELLKEAFRLSVRLCATFCSRKHPEMDEEWFMDNTSVAQVREFASAIREALERAYEGINKNSKNG